VQNRCGSPVSNLNFWPLGYENVFVVIAETSFCRNVEAQVVQFYLFSQAVCLYVSGAEEQSQPASVWYLYGKPADRLGCWSKDLQATTWKQVHL